jgi:hypothetical protein
MVEEELDFPAILDDGYEDRGHETIMVGQEH